MRAERRLALVVVALVAFVIPVPAEATRPPADVVLVLDASASMTANDPNRVVPGAAAAFVDRLGENDAAGLVEFGANAAASRALGALAPDGVRAALRTEIAAIRYDERYTDMAAGVERALYELRTNARPDARRVLVFMTDGIMDTGSATRDAERTAWLTGDLLDDAKRLGVTIYAIALSEQADYMLIRRLAVETGGEYFRATKGDEVASVFETISTRLDRDRGGARPAPAPPGQTAAVSRFRIAAGLAALAVAGVVLLVFAALRYRARRPALARGAAEPSGPLPEAALVDFRTGSRIPIVGPTTTIGRDGGNEIVLDSETVSANHARIELHDRQFVVVDLRSTNGTFVNGQRVAAPTVLQDGDLLDFDELHYQFVGALAGVKKTVARNAAIQQTQVRGAPNRPATSAPGTRPEPVGREAIANRAATHRLVSCFIHRDRRAVERCARCGTAGCGTCVTIAVDGPVCRTCAAEPLPRTPA